MPAIDNVSWRDSEAELRTAAKAKAAGYPGGFSGYVKALIQADLAGISPDLRKAIREAVGEALADAGGVMLPSKKVEEIPSEVLRSLTDGLFKG